MNHHKYCLSNHNGPCNCEEVETVIVCTDCHAEVVEKCVGDEGWSVCTGCGNVEQGTEVWSVEKFEVEGLL